VLAADFALSELAMPGARLLRDYLAFAERGPEALREELDSIGGDFESPFEESVADAIRALGYQPIPQIGVGGFRIDLGVVNPTAPGEFALGIECDGATYHSTPTARDRDRLRQQVLEDLGWRITRIWSRDWVRDRPAELTRLKADIETAIREGRPTRRRPTTPLSEPAPERQRDTIEVHDITSAEAAESLPWVTTYQRCELPALPSTIEFHDPALRPRLVGRLQALIDVESPIAVGYAISRLAEAAGIARRGSRVMEAGTKAINEAARQGILEQRGDYLWMPGRPIWTVRTPDRADQRTRRGIDEIPPEEIDLAMQRLREASGTVDADRLISQTARVLGFDRAGGRIQTAIAERLRKAAEADKPAATRVEPCPHCGQKNRVVPGYVRCGRCRQTFEVVATPT
jgi:very-short-patch-repair endonuclease